MFILERGRDCYWVDDVVLFALFVDQAVAKKDFLDCLSDAIALILFCKFGI